MSEAKLLLFASFSMFIVSALFAVLLHYANAGAAWVMLGGTVAGIAVYVGICIFGNKSAREE